MNNITIAGNVGKDATVRTTQGGDPVAGWSVAVNDGKDQTLWFECSLFGDRASKLAPYIKKGSKICVSGRVAARVYDGKAYLQVIVSQVTFMSSKSDGAAPGRGESLPNRPPTGGGSAGQIDDEIPFAYQWK